MNRYLYNAGNERNEMTRYDETFYRLYDPALGRFAGVDILAVADASSSMYNYAGSNPIFYNDPMGDRKAPPEPVRVQGGWTFASGGFGDMFLNGGSHAYGNGAIVGNDVASGYVMYIVQDGKVVDSQHLFSSDYSGLPNTEYSGIKISNGQIYVMNPWGGDEVAKNTYNGEWIDVTSKVGQAFLKNKGAELYPDFTVQDGGLDPYNFTFVENEADAYREMLSLVHSRDKHPEIMAYLVKNSKGKQGVLVLPFHENTEFLSKTYANRIKNGMITDFEKNAYTILGMVHTHTYYMNASEDDIHNAGIISPAYIISGSDYYQIDPTSTPDYSPQTTPIGPLLNGIETLFR